MPDYSAYQIDLDTPQPGGGRGESPRSAFTKVNELMVTLGTDIEGAATQITAAGDLNARVTPGDFYFTVAQTNQPPGLTGSFFMSVRGRTNAIVQEIVMRQATARRWWRMLYLSDGSWTAWREVADVTPLPASAVAAGTDANTLVVPGPYYVNSDAQATAALNWPVTLAGTLEVVAAAAGNLQVTQTYTTRNGAGGAVRTFKRVRFGTGGTWGTWQEVARAVDSMQHGQCRFTAISSTQCALQPKNGRGLVINGKQCWIPAGGALVSNSGLAASTLYYAYAKDDGAGVAQVEFQAASAAPHSMHTDGVEIKTGDPSRTLVGMVYTNNPASFINSGPTRWVSSWFNRVEAATAETPVNSPTTSTSYVKLTNGLYPMLWAGDTALVAATGIVTTSVAAMGAYHILTVNGSGFAGGHGYTLGNPGYQYPSGCVAPYIAGSDGMYNFALYGMSGSASAAITFRHDLNCRWPQ